MDTREKRLAIAAGCVTAGGVFVGAAALFHFIAAPHLPEVLKPVLEPRAFAFLEPIVSFTFALNGVLLLPLSFSTFHCAMGIRRGERRAWWIGLANAATVLALPVLIASIMGVGYFSGAPLFLAGAASVAVAGLLMMLPLLWTWNDAAPPSGHRA